MNNTTVPPRFFSGSPLLRRLGLVLLAGLLAVPAARADLIFAWGDNSAGQCAIPPGLTNVQALAGGYKHSLALESNGTVVAWGFNNFGQTNVPAGLTNVAAVAGGFSYSMALRSNGTVVVWGNQPAPPAGLSGVTAIAGGWFHSLALKSNGTVVAWGATSGTATNVPAGLANVLAIGAGSNVSLAVQSNGTVVAWGDNTFGQTNVPAAATNVASITAGQAHCLALRRDGSVVAWGGDFDGQSDVPGDLTNAVAVGAGAYHSIAMRQDGTLEAWGNNTFNQTNITQGLAGFFAIATGGYHDLALSGSGTPIILSAPASQTAYLTESATLSVLAVGTSPLNFQWLKNGTNVAGATNSALTIAFVTTDTAGSYKVVVSNYIGTATSPAAVVTTVGQAPDILAQSQSQPVVCGDTPVLSVTVQGSTPLAYQWRFNGSPIFGATSSSLALAEFTTNEQGSYTAVITNAFGSITSAIAAVTMVVEPPSITSPLTATAAQGQPFSYTITALHGPIEFGASGLPEGLTINPATGVISGTNLESGTFGILIAANNPCTSDLETLVLNVTPSAPVITSLLTASGTAGSPFSYQITATQTPTNYTAEDLPTGLVVDPNSGIISGTPAYGGVYDSTIFASNAWGAGSATLQFTFASQPIAGLSIANVAYSYASPYLLNFQFSLFDNTNAADGDGLVVDPTNLVATCLENGVAVIPGDTGIIVRRGSIQSVSGYLVLDFADSMASLSNGETNGISDAIETEVNGAEFFVSEQPASTQLGVFAFWRDDEPPAQIVPLTNNPSVLNNAIAGIWANDVQGFTSGSRTWDATLAAITAFGPANTNQQRFILLISDGQDESSTATLDAVITAATNAAVEVFCVGLGDELTPAPLMQLASQTMGHYYTATNFSDVFDLISKDNNNQYTLRWATLKRTSTPFQPSFQITYQDFTADSPTNQVVVDTNDPPTYVTNNGVITTNYPFVTNFIIGPYTPTLYAGGVTTGLLSVASSGFGGEPTDLALAAYYVPRDINEIRVHYRANWPCTVSLSSTNPGDMLFDWSVTPASDGSNGTWLTLTSPSPTNYITFASFGDLLTFSFSDIIPAVSGAFSLLAVDNTIYTNTGGQSFVITNVSTFETTYPTLPFGTPVPWLMSYGFSGNFTNAELLDPDHDGMKNWQEYRANTIPTNAASKLVVTKVSKAPDGVRYQVTFSTSEDRTYSLQSSLDLMNWQTVQDNIPGIGTPATNVDVTIIDTNYYPDTTHVFYRVQVY